jgi:hypothetical protein
MTLFYAIDRFDGRDWVILEDDAAPWRRRTSPLGASFGWQAKLSSAL